MIDKKLQICSFKQAKRLEELGFDWNVTAGYRVRKIDGGYNYGEYELVEDCESGNYNLKDMFNGWNISAPTIALALEYMRIEKGIVCAVEIYGKNDYKWTAYNGAIRVFTNVLYGTYRDAENDLLDTCLSILEQKKS